MTKFDVFFFFEVRVTAVRQNSRRIPTKANNPLIIPTALATKCRRFDRELLESINTPIGEVS